MPIDRDAQRKILETLAEKFPAHCDTQNPATYGLTDNELYFQIAYLEQHGLLMANWSRAISTTKTCITAVITAKGLDFLADDGGLSAILGVVTIRLHDDTLKRLIEAKILQSDLPQPDKKRWLDQLRSLPAETTKHLVLKLVDLGLAETPTAISAIGKFLADRAAG